MKRIPEETIDRIRNQTDIVDIIGHYVQLKKQGRNYIGLCPFHGEKTPSFSVSPEKQIFHCFGCGKGGNVFSFLMEHDHLTFTEAVHKVAELSHLDVELPQLTSGESAAVPKETSETHKMIEMHQLATKLYHYLLLETEEGLEALNYLKERGMSEELIQTFQIGFAPNHHATITSFFEKRDLDLHLAVAAGLLSERDNGDIVDRFRNRIMFPITDDRGQLVGFSGRLYKQEEGPKYLNSPETPIFNKRKLLYHFSEGRQSIRKYEEVLLLEGFMDVISVSETGLLNGIASMGTSLTEEHIGLIKRVANRAVICYDGDNAGIEAAFKAGNLLAQAKIEIYVLSLPSGKDPDEYIRTYGADKFQTFYTHERQTWTAFKLYYLSRKRNMANDTERLAYIDEALFEIGKIDQAVERELYLKQLSDEFDITIPTLKEQLQRAVQELSRQKSRAAESYDFSNMAPPPDESFDDFQTMPKERGRREAHFVAEQHLMKAMIEDQDAFSQIHQLLEGSRFYNDDFQALYTHLIAYYLDGNEASASRFMDYLTDMRLKNVVSSLEMIESPEEQTMEAYSDYILSMKKYRLEIKIKQKEQEVHEKMRLQDHKGAIQASTEVILLRKSLANKDYDFAEDETF
ncbi:DNA primase [Listeria fleischmannii]|jgi:DNA primase|uniref:DNA primase n=2 Tax=Listeria fleischmannii TaxID=1069827 RepID=W7DQA1_9LIST|nr:DNA primase [Listeria fleischmannii]EIA19973.1 DNA primase [Listeria fleischmannii subsp. coloradonensis]EUJ64456.1 DNA primase [Listeria fleischmannii FSL S10-1203]MBC1399288.1 DNA primase [Listeria fleischmannii]MBC1427560.1 DNA primase [Listeria fleischmannii]STY34944.1 DNA primase [Listeria fleischmannii subsp. coloradonensis]